MDNAVATIAPTPLKPIPAPGAAPGQNAAASGPLSRWQQLPLRTQLAALAGLAALIAVLAVMFSGARDSDYRPLFPNLSEKDGGAVIDKLVQMGVPYKFAEGGSAIMVPSGRVAELRMKLAAQGLPSTGAGGVTGYELLDKNTFGQTQGQERMRIQRAIEGELTTTIESLEQVKSARVHLALPRTNGFFREEEKPSASVVLMLQPGHQLDRNQIAGIVRLVSGSVPDLAPKNVNVVDSTGALLTAGNDGDGGQGLDSEQLQYRHEIEASAQRRILDLLDPVLGRDNVRATVSADIDFSQVMQTAEAYHPNQGASAPAAVREQRTEQSIQPGSATPSGVPGAMSNQPPVPASAPINGPAQTLQGTQVPGAGGGSERRDSATRYEVDKTVTVTRQVPGSVRRLSAAVVVNNRTTTDAKGKTTSTPLTTKELDQLTALVQQGIGYNAARGDMVKVVNAPFRVEALPAPEAVPLWKQPWLIDLLKTAAAPLALAVVALVIVSKMIKPALSVMLAPPPAPEPGSQVNEAVDDAVVLPPPEPPMIMVPGQGDKVDAVRALAKSNPAAVAHIVRGWVNGESA
ncbi:MAG: flagellar M-ring protein FliF [Burkholderiales bacterium]|nr:flagellar M-ring protein FliF [Burkholderiales bacterium]MDE1927241.1 flagellar M-ring protein FliF [Burkholderiales bacterium]MDE2158997.1 flagellar M-ring protein FliF [Burkholderiales bacterium]MDE2501583.1 flagellar M-ring protein FliF [Burkholderiales bacterium]